MSFMDFLSKLFSSLGAKKQLSALMVEQPSSKPVESTSAMVMPTTTNIPAPVSQKFLDLNAVTYKESPNKSERKDQVRGIVLHHTGPGSFNGIVTWLVNPDAKVSAHYVVGINGELIQLVNTKKAAWHAGTSKWTLDGETRYNLNHCTIGIEICNIGIMSKHDNGKYYYEVGESLMEYKGSIEPLFATITYPSGKTLSGYFTPYPEVQVNKIIDLCKAIVSKYPQIGREDIMTHFGVATPEGKKNDPFGLDIQDIINKIFV